MVSLIPPVVINKKIIKAWTGLIANIPKDWQICDGTNGTPDLRASFVRGAPTSSDAGGTGGADTVTLDSTMIPSHNHGITDAGHLHTVAGIFRDDQGTGSNHKYSGSQTTSATAATITINNQGGGGSHNNLPTYYHVIYIMKMVNI